MNIEDKQKAMLADDLTAYINEKHNQDKCTGFIDGYNAALSKVKNLGLFDVSKRSELLIGLIRKDTDVTISGQFKGRLFGYRQESFLVEYNHNGQCEWVSIDDITT